ncbi:MAG: hypothetical protein PW843_29755 [Azospirillaceae bacterium]|nr:hypothetical protein [Azospirillaceae bacterium]
MVGCIWRSFTVRSFSAVRRMSSMIWATSLLSKVPSGATTSMIQQRSPDFQSSADSWVSPASSRASTASDRKAQVTMPAGCPALSPPL